MFTWGGTVREGLMKGLALVWKLLVALSFEAGWGPSQKKEALCFPWLKMSISRTGRVCADASKANRQMVLWTCNTKYVCYKPVTEAHRLRAMVVGLLTTIMKIRVRKLVLSTLLILVKMLVTKQKFMDCLFNCTHLLQTKPVCVITFLILCINEPERNWKQKKSPLLFQCVLLGTNVPACVLVWKCW